MNGIKFDDSFNWLAVLKDLAAGMPITQGEYERLVKKAGAWPTCACGQLCSLLPRSGPLGEPEDACLWSWGLTFYQSVKHRDWKYAMATFHKIEARTAELLEAMK